MEIIAFVNQKGGVAKTTTCLNVGAGLSFCGFKCLLVDLDPQGNLSTSLGLTPGDDDLTTYEVLKGSDINQAIKPGKYDVLPTDIRLSGAELELASTAGRDFLLKEALENLKTKYDYILIDCAPSLNILTLMALTASNEIYVPVKADYLGLNGIAQLLETVDLVKKRLNTKLKIGGVILTFYDSRRGLDQEVIESLRKKFGDIVFKTAISNNIKLAEAPSHYKDIFTYAPNCNGAQQYKALVDEIIHETTERETRK